jgi:acetyl esterase/lipase
MNSRPLVDPELLPLLDSMPAMDFSGGILPAIRSMPVPFVGYADYAGTTRLERRVIPGPNGAPSVEIFIYSPNVRDGLVPGILHIHGGGYVSGTVQSQEVQHRAFAAELSCLVISVDYRLAPETPYPGPIEDCYAALIWIAKNASVLGLDMRRLGVMGESAGGGLAAALSILTRDRGDFAIAFQHLIYPMLDDRTGLSEPHPYAGEFMWTAASNRFGWTSLLGHLPGGNGVSPYAAAARAEDLRGLPRTFIATGALDLFAEENLEFARRLMRSGVPVELHVYPGAYHGFDILTDASVARTARRDSLNALRQSLRA